MNTGYYKELETLKKDYPESDFGFLENEYNEGYLSAYDCLHGFCDVFSFKLSEMFKDYEVESLKNEDGLVHSYCKKTVDGKTFFIDIRGITDDYEEFVSEFGDFVSFTNEPVYPLEGTVKGSMEEVLKFYNKRFDEYFSFCQKIIEENKDFYRI